MRLTITINMDNAAFGDTEKEQLEEVNEILMRLTLRQAHEQHLHKGLLTDSNGNTVGHSVVKFT